MVLILELPQNDEIGPLTQPAGGGAEPLQRLVGLRAQLFREIARALQAQRRYVRGLALPRILAGGLAQRGGARVGVEHIVDDLEREADGFGVAIELFSLRFTQVVAA